MALNKTALKNGIKSLVADMRIKETDSDEEYATRLTDLIEAFVKSATISYSTGLVAPNGAVTGTFTHTIT